VRDAGRCLPVSLFVNDVDRHMLARNIVLLWLAHHAPPAHVFAVWFSLGLSASAHAALHEALDALTGPSCSDHLAKIGVGFWRPDDRSRIGDVLCEWKQMRLRWERIQTQRRELFRRSRNPSMGHRRLGSNPLRISKITMSEPDSDALLEQLDKEMAAYFQTGSIVPLGEEQAPPPELRNPTLFRSASAYDLDYDANPYSAFPLFASEYAQHRPWTALCMREMETWVAELKARTGGARWAFGCEDCLQLCAAVAPRQFDVVATGDVADHVGLLPLLQAARLVTRQGGTLLTSTMTYITYSDNLDEYLASHLFLEPALWPGVLGWRCVGREWALKPQSSEIQLRAANSKGLFFKSQLRQFNVSRKGVVRGKLDLDKGGADQPSPGRVPRRAGHARARLPAVCGAPAFWLARRPSRGGA
jgi:hypothetical protein